MRAGERGQCAAGLWSCPIGEDALANLSDPELPEVVHLVARIGGIGWWVAGVRASTVVRALGAIIGLLSALADRRCTALLGVA